MIRTGVAKGYARLRTKPPRAVHPRVKRENKLTTENFINNHRAPVSLTHLRVFFYPRHRPGSFVTQHRESRSVKTVYLMPFSRSYSLSCRQNRISHIPPTPRTRTAHLLFSSNGWVGERPRWERDTNGKFLCATFTRPVTPYRTDRKRNLCF